ncbi:glycine cleavage system aminomethyltransferase GcvT [Caldinitratiruptor microaerophilus]|uniref:Aminomethyltransferase n=1 Tax=Caldinitratiruptor microaerophilus TaxID=671077 RepID=A0AA35G5W2_9FIRM|nr:glycine cleavage system aminomethyltransferase GcvT [Caldinitratiruptor microaerophilus]BDG60241.1 aminomethyltransferase [Caldinitratiruptor microaerophilus]
MAEELRRTPLYDAHVRLGARMVPFAGWEMPVQYTGIVEEHRAVRTAAGLFDVSHMGEFEFTGPGAREAVDRLVTNNVSRLTDGKALYSPMCYPDGTVVDDVLVYRLGPEHFWMVVNAANTDKDFAWVTENTRDIRGLAVRNISGEVAQLALQGPRAQAILQPLAEADLGAIEYYAAAYGVKVAGLRTLVLSRTGYTGEDGFEIYVPAADAATLWHALLEAGRPHGLLPAGLGARDTLRLEASMPLYGHEIDHTTTPLEAGLGSFVKLKKGEFIGREALARQKEEGLRRKLVCFEMLDRGGIPRQGYEIARDGEVVGRVTSGTQSPTLGKPIGMGYVPAHLGAEGTEFDVLIRGRALRARVVPRPFYRRTGPAAHPTA